MSGAHIRHAFSFDGINNMGSRKHILIITLIISISILTAATHLPVYPAKANNTIQAPILKWQYAGCYSSWCETGWHSSPAIADLDQDGSVEVIASAYSIFVLEGATGDLKWQMASGHDRSEPEANNVGRTWPGIAVADVDGNGDIEIISAHSGGYVSVYNHNGYFEPGWPQRPTDRELRGLSVYDLDQDGSLEIIVTGAVYNQTNTWVFEHNGVLRPGWPQLNNESGYAHGVFNNNAAIGNLDKDPSAEIVIPSDVHYVCAYESNGNQIPANAMYGEKGWGKVGVWESLETELRGWGTCSASDGRAERYRPNFAHGPSAIGDVNADGVNEVNVVGNVYDCIPGYHSQYNGPYIFNADRSRFNASGFDWRTPPVDTGAPLSEDYGLIENNQPNPALADLDGDGYLEILFASYDGRMHAYWLDKSEHGNWPYSVYQPGEGFYRFASEPVVVDLDNDGTAEVIFSSWVQKGAYATGKLHITDYLGDPVHEVNLPMAYGSPDWNGALAAPTLGDIDGDPDLEVVLNTAHSGFVAYDLPNTAGARIQWGTGRGNFQRSGSILRGSLQASAKYVDKALADPGETIRYTLVLRNPGPDLTNVVLTDTLPAQITFAGNLSASAGLVSQAGSTVTWTGAVNSTSPVTIQFEATIQENLSSPQAIVNTAEISDGWGNKLYLQAITFANGYGLFFPFISGP